MDLDITLDALPYIDEYSPEMEAEVYRLIEAQMQLFSPPNYLEHHAPVALTFSTPFLQSEWERIQAEGATGHQPAPMQALDQTRYSVPQPSTEEQKNPEAWQDALDNACAQLQHQLVRAENIELLMHYGPNAWRLYNEKIEDIRARLVKVLDETKKSINEVNLSRKSKQLPLQSTLEHLHAEWLTTVRKNVEIEKACSDLEQEIAALKKDSMDVEVHQ